MVMVKKLQGRKVDFYDEECTFCISLLPFNTRKQSLFLYQGFVRDVFLGWFQAVWQINRQNSYQAALGFATVHLA